MIRNRYTLFLCLVLAFSFIGPSPKSAASNGSVTILENNVNIREGPGLSYKIVRNVKKRNTFEWIQAEGDWIQINLSDGQKGWVANWLVSVIKSKKSTSQTMSSNLAVINTDGLRVRGGPGTSYKVLGTLKKGLKVKTFQTDGNWIQIDTVYGKGWVSKEFVEITSGQAPSSSTTNSVSKIGIITVNSLNVRDKPALQGSILGKLQKGAEVSILSKQSEWTEILFKSRSAWISSEFVQLQSDNKQTQNSTHKPVKSPSGIVGRVTATTLNVRETNSLNGRVIGTVTKGEQYSVIEEKNNWAKIKLHNGSYGWIAGWYLDKSSKIENPKQEQAVKESKITIIHNGTNIRKNPNLNSDVVRIANTGENYKVTSLKNDWYEITLPNGTNGYVAGWIVSVEGTAPQVEKPGAEMHLKNKTIVLDPGHGGRDNGATGSKGTFEKWLTLHTAQLLYEKLKTSGARVILTRKDDSYIALSSRVSIAEYNGADAFVSIHYDSSLNKGVRGMTSYYYHSYQKGLAASVNSSIAGMTKINNRGVRFGDYHVLRENTQNAVLVELGYLSNPAEEMLITSSQYQEQVASGIYQGLAKYFKQ